MQAISDRPVGHYIAGLCCAVAVAGPVAFALWKPLFDEPPPFSGGGVAGFMAVLLLVALILVHNTVIQGEDGSASTMRIATLGVVGTFCVIMLRTAWEQNRLPSLEGQGNWVWLVTAALGGKAAQKYIELHRPAELPSTQKPAVTHAVVTQAPAQPTHDAAPQPVSTVVAIHGGSLATDATGKATAERM